MGRKKPLPTPRNEVALAAVGSKIYVVGGGIGGNAVPLIDEYDPASDSWRRWAAMSRPDHLGVVISNTIVTVGGFIGSVHRGAVSEVHQYDVGSNSWKSLAPLKAPRGSVAVAVLDGRTHAVGGRGVDNTFTVGTHEVFDPATGQWTERAALPQPRDHLALVAVDGKLHAIGGRVTNPASRTGQHDVYDPKTDSGRPARRCRLRAAGSLMRISTAWLYRGELPPDTFAENEAYDPKSMRWRTLTAMPADAMAPAPRSSERASTSPRGP